MKVIVKPAQLYAYMDSWRKKKKKWNFSQLDSATGTKTGFNRAVVDSVDMKISTILRLLDVLGLEMVIRVKEAPAPAPRAYVPTTVLSPSATPQPEGAPEA